MQQQKTIIGSVFGSLEGLANLASVLLALLALGLAPWPGLASFTSSRWLLLWAAVEGAFLLPLLPGLAAGAPPVVRATMRAAQTGVAGRTLLWLAVGVGPALGNDWSLATLPGRALAVLAVVFALPAALTWGPFGPVPALSGLEVGLEDRLVQLIRLASRFRQGVLLLVSLMLILVSIPLPPVAALSLLVGVLLLAWFELTRFAGRWPQLTLPAALRMCWMRALPLGLAAIIYVAFLEISRR